MNGEPKQVSFVHSELAEFFITFIIYVVFWRKFWDAGITSSNKE